LNASLRTTLLINRVLPVEGRLDVVDELTTFDGRKISVGSTAAHRSDLREWQISKRNVELIDPVFPFASCEEEDIDTNYVRLFREVAGCGTGKMIGILPPAEVVRYIFK
jgi:hypothetical protein